VIAEFEHGFAAFELRSGCDQRTHRGGGAALPADHASQLALGHEQLDERLSAVSALRDAYRVGPVCQRTGHHFDDVAGPAHDAACSVAGAGGAAGGIRATSVRIVSDG
jgi:hypothetical protein